MIDSIIENGIITPLTLSDIFTEVQNKRLRSISEYFKKRNLSVQRYVYDYPEFFRKSRGKVKGIVSRHYYRCCQR